MFQGRNVKIFPFFIKKNAKKGKLRLMLKKVTGLLLLADRGAYRARRL